MFLFTENVPSFTDATTLNWVGGEGGTPLEGFAGSGVCSLVRPRGRMEKTRSLRYHLAPPYGTSCGRPVIGQLINLRRPLLLTNERARCLGLQLEEDANLATTVKPNGLLIDSQSL